ncbi:Putative neutral zinc metallopeptidase [Nonomuraea coxensis DSM 45129]|uniref:Neutral zinc metallopeptidase n=1 Tax=Nonomuraea coxensis DSM 45129 TaxID=1122611 RepID=A0ABX8TT10_9ACTN|nr:neutral zinc metallopeptidase [Nonomuraea coxensis]QYC38605.1 Putative neutral zinc metallopeptidase [Nonomuraea coxensis DSM 45129]
MTRATLRRLLALLVLAGSVLSCGLARPPSMNPPGDAQQDDTFEDDVVSARTLTEEFWKQQFARLGRTYRPITEFIPYSGADGPGCGGRPAVPNNAFYCPAGHFIAFDRDWMEALWSDMGDGSVYVIIPHEFGHAVQAQLRSAFQLNVQAELQADCYAGGTLSALVGSGALRTEPGDEDELLLSLEAAGDPTDDWLDPAAHGTAEQRQASFAEGYRSGVGAC